MRKIVIVYGLIAGAIVACLMCTWISLWQRGHVTLENGEVYGYGSMLVALSMVFFGIKSYRDNQSNRAIGFWKGLQVGLLISLLASVVYAGGWETFLLLNPETKDSFFQKYSEYYIDKLKEKGAGPEEIDRVKTDMASMGEMYKNPLFRFGFTMVEILPVGILVTLLSAGILRRKELLAE